MQQALPSKKKEKHRPTFPDQLLVRQRSSHWTVRQHGGRHRSTAATTAAGAAGAAGVQSAALHSGHHQDCPTAERPEAWRLQPLQVWVVHGQPEGLAGAAAALVSAFAAATAGVCAAGTVRGSQLMPSRLTAPASPNPAADLLLLLAADGTGSTVPAGCARCTKPQSFSTARGATRSGGWRCST